MCKNQFVAHDGIYLLNHSVGRPTVSARNSLLEDFFEPWEHGDAEVWPVWIRKIEQFGMSLGRLLNAESSDFCPQTNLSSAVTKVIHSLPAEQGKSVILYSEQDFPSIGFVLSQAQRAGFKLRMIPAAVDTQDPDVWESYLTDDVRLVLVTQVYSNTSQLLPVSEITRLAKEKNILSIVDICQAVGVVPTNLQSWQADFVVGSCVKWLCGGPGAGFLWVNPEIVELCQPIDVGWFSHENPFEFDITNFRYADKALRFWGGTPSVMPYALAASSIDVMCKIGLERIREHNLELNNIILDGLGDDVTVTPKEASKRGGTLVLNFGEYQDEIITRLNQAQVRFDARNSGLRISPHIYNTKEEMETILSLMTR